MNRYIKKFAYSLSLLLLMGACGYFNPDEVVDPNNPSLDGVLSGATKAELQSLITGLEARHRVPFENATELFGSFGREVYAYFGSDPRFTEEWLGLEINETYPDFFASAGTFLSPYQAIKQANVIIEAAENTEAITEQERLGYEGFARTIKGFQYLYPLMQQWDNGIRIDVTDPLNPGDILPYDEALSQIRDLLDRGADDLRGAGNSFDFSLTNGFDDYDTPAGMLQVNRAIAARAAVYDEDWAGALEALEESFMDLEGDLMAGPAHVYGESPDVNNPFFYPLNAITNTILIVHPSMVEDALEGDERLNKFFERNQAVTNSTLINESTGELIPGEYQDNRWETNLDPVKFIRNEELILLYAEANAQLNNTDEAERAINIIRNTWGLDDYEGASTSAALIDEILFQRRYSLWAEGGHRWIDMRRYGRLDEIPTGLEGGTVFEKVSPRNSELNWESQN
ncbi:MAG: RagB/SusD family nutrient uptake outer membrane protein [Cyclobacteriaceae bacterium]